ncbi:DUF805 domain-containing protein [Marinomonas colpomeniae]|uniref:DUF805 domain-containing protein n=1 Tax=Marinomonas colpomeniae TaxID=2774408 RepID=A0ABR8P277_9GAMM|nr:DUF805 domain-containing protein [Marinomonas colpomeniae]MBD5770872.1 DUF805 domain-containing protein [Marinomonas colpomeniae]
MNWYFDAWKQYAVFSGTASREAFWMFLLLNVLISAAFVVLEIFFEMTWRIEALYSLLIFLPTLSLTVRRLHDTGRSTWWLLVMLVPAIGMVALFVLLALPSAPQTNDTNYPQNGTVL